MPLFLMDESRVWRLREPSFDEEENDSFEDDLELDE